MVGPSALGQVAVCPARKKFPKTTRRGKSGKSHNNPFADEGTDLHRHIEDWINRVKDHGDFENPKSWITLLSDVENNRIRRGADTLVRYLDRLKKKKNLIVIELDSELEGDFIHDSSGIKISYIIDLIIGMKGPKNSNYNIVIDWKRTLNHSHSDEDNNYAWQLKLYSMMMHVLGRQVDEAMLVSLENDAKYMRKISVDISTPINLDRIIEEWEGQETRPSRKNCGNSCPRFRDNNNPCPDAELPSLDEIDLDNRRVPFRELNLDAKIWSRIVINKVATVEAWGATIEKSPYSSIFISPDQGVQSCDVRGVARARSMPEGEKLIEVEPAIFIPLED